MSNSMIRSPDPYRWYAVYVKSRTEKKVLTALEWKGIEFYFPVKKIKRQWGKQSRVVEVPLISCYVFVKVSNREFYDVLITNGVLRYVSFEGRPAAIPECQIDALKFFLKEQNEDIGVTSERIKKGDLIKVTSGPLKGISAEVSAVCGKRRIILRFTGLGCCFHVDLGKNMIEMIGKRNAKKASVFF
jgi:transcription antitermination factor NusG